MTAGDVSREVAAPVAAPWRRRRAGKPPPRPSDPTPIVISRRAWTWLLITGAILLAALVWRAGILPLAVGGLALAVVLSFPVGLLSRVMPRGAAIALSFLLSAAVLAALTIGVVPLLVDQLGALAQAAPAMARRLGERVPSLLDRLAERGILPTAPDQFLENLQREVLSTLQSFAGRLVAQLGRVFGRAASTAVTLLGVVIVAAYLLANSRRIQAATLRAAPKKYRRDTLDLWNAFRSTLSRYLAGLALSLAIQGLLSAIALYFLGVPYAAVLGAWVAVTALIPFLGAWIGAIPAVLVALSESPTTALLTAVLFLLIQQLESNVLTPRIQGQAIKVRPLVVFLAVIAAGELGGLAGVVLAVPVVAVLRVLFDFFRARVRVLDDSAARGQHVVASQAGGGVGDLAVLHGGALVGAAAVSKSSEAALPP